MPIPDTNLGDNLKICLGNPWALDADLPAVVSAFPYLGGATGGDWVITNSGEITGYVVRRW